MQHVIVERDFVKPPERVFASSPSTRTSSCSSGQIRRLSDGEDGPQRRRLRRELRSGPLPPFEETIIESSRRADPLHDHQGSPLRHHAGEIPSRRASSERTHTALRDRLRGSCPSRAARRGRLRRNIPPDWSGSTARLEVIDRDAPRDTISGVLHHARLESCRRCRAVFAELLGAIDFEPSRRPGPGLSVLWFGRGDPVHLIVTEGATAPALGHAAFRSTTFPRRSRGLGERDFEVEEARQLWGDRRAFVPRRAAPARADGRPAAVGRPAGGPWRGRNLRSRPRSRRSWP